ncbi:iron-uptake factor PiuC [Klebsiella pneumoniae]|uniref:Iron-uptake factor PiuC n=1 Tax=Klebsiella pneumoniae TaxID=573 RepID=A0A378H593_KLEPN|nr:iron-uptake factor PiuC [Klebsiella pneumoniae]
MVRDDKQRAMLYDLDRTIQSLKARFGDGEEVLSCSTCITTCCASGRKCDPLLMTEACGRQV